MCGAILGFFGNLFSDESKYIKAQMEMEQRMAMERKRQYESQAQAEILAAQQKANDIKEQAAKLKKRNLAAFASSGVDINSPSYGAFLQANKEATSKDLRNARMMGIERANNAMLGARQAVMEGQAAQISGQARLSARRTRLWASAGDVVGEAIGIGLALS
tara:strand:+ start:159 stop:641 length:483 start_codon:yes stop_codon:yes gene_type:complete